MIDQSHFGRPEDKDIEREFMKKIRGDKLQAINAQCELEICLAFNYGKKKSHGTTRKNKTKETEQSGQSMKAQVQVLQIGTSDNFSVHRRQQLELNFDAIKQKWKFEQIQQNQPLPDYFFDDGCDLSYILYELQKTERPEFQKFSAEDLLFLEFLCLQGRKRLNETIIDYYKNNMNFMVEAMRNGLLKIQEKLKSLAIINNSKSKDRKISNQEAPSQYPQANDDLRASSSNLKQTDEKNIKKKKRKIIEKKNDKKKKQKKNKKGDDSQEQNQQQENASQQNNYPKDKQLALKTCNYIAWAYWYIIKKD